MLPSQTDRIIVMNTSTSPFSICFSSLSGKLGWHRFYFLIFLLLAFTGFLSCWCQGLLRIDITGTGPRGAKKKRKKETRTFFYLKRLPLHGITHYLDTPTQIRRRRSGSSCVKPIQGRPCYLIKWVEGVRKGGPPFNKWNAPFPFQRGPSLFRASCFLWCSEILERKTKKKLGKTESGRFRMLAVRAGEGCFFFIKF